MHKTNETYKIEITSPLVRPGIKISTKVSKKYLVSTLTDLLNQLREFNAQQGEQ